MNGALRKNQSHLHGGRTFPWALVVIFCFGVGLRLLKFVLAGPVSFDEAWSHWTGAKSIPELLKIVFIDKHPPLYYFFMHFWNYFFYSEIWIRLPSLMLSIVNLFLFYLIAKQIFKPKNTFLLIALFLFALAPFQVDYSAIARMYIPATTLLLISTYSFFRLVESPDRKWLLINMGSNVLALLTHYVCGFAIPVQFAFLSIGFIGKRIEKRTLFSWLKYHLPILVVIIILVPIVISQIRTGGVSPRWLAEMHGVPSLRKLAETGAMMDLTHGLTSSWHLPVMVFFMALIVLGLFMRTNPQRNGGSFRLGFHPDFRIWYLAGLYTVPIGIFWTISQVAPLFHERYFIPFYFAWFIIVTVGIQRIPFKYFRVVIVIATSVIVMLSTYKYIFRPYQESDWRAKTHIISENWKDGDVLLVMPPADYIRFSFYLRAAKDIPFDQDLYRQFLTSRKDTITAEVLSRVFLTEDFPYGRIWYHEESGTGLSADFYLHKEHTMLNFFDKHFQDVPEMEFSDKRGILKLYIVKQSPDNSVK